MTRELIDSGVLGYCLGVLATLATIAFMLGRRDGHDQSN